MRILTFSSEGRRTHAMTNLDLDLRRMNPFRDDCVTLARQYQSMVRGNLFMQAPKLGCPKLSCFEAFVPRQVDNASPLQVPVDSRNCGFNFGFSCWAKVTQEYRRFLAVGFFQATGRASGGASSVSTAVDDFAMGRVMTRTRGFTYPHPWSGDQADAQCWAEAPYGAAD